LEEFVRVGREFETGDTEMGVVTGPKFLSVKGGGEQSERIRATFSREGVLLAKGEFLDSL